MFTVMLTTCWDHKIFISFRRLLILNSIQQSTYSFIHRTKSLQRIFVLLQHKIWSKYGYWTVSFIRRRAPCYGGIWFISQCLISAPSAAYMRQRTKSALVQIMLEYFNPLRAKFFWGNINIYLHFMSVLHIDSTQVLKILPQVRPGPIYSTQSISWLLMSWRRKEPGHQQPWYWPS